MLTLKVVPSDDLEQRACAGDANAFGLLAERWDRDLRGVVWSVVRSSHATDDVMQAAYERAFRSIGSFNKQASLKTWLHSICYRSALDYLRYEGRRRHDDIDAERSLRVVGDTADQAIARVNLDATFAALAAEDRTLLMLTAGLGHTVDEAATILDMPRGTAASRIRRARQRMAAPVAPPAPTEEDQR